MTIDEKVDFITDKIYAAYGSDSGVLFGIGCKDVVKAIIRFTLRNIEDE